MLLEPLPPADGPDYLDALPLVARLATHGDDNGGDSAIWMMIERLYVKAQCMKDIVSQ